MAMIKSVNDNPPAYLTSTFDYDFLSTHGPAIVGGPQRFAERLVYLSELVGADLNLIKMDMGGVPREEYVDMVERLGSVIPLMNVRSPAAVAANA
jgi:hypothetical protein